MEQKKTVCFVELLNFSNIFLYVLPFFITEKMAGRELQKIYYVDANTLGLFVSKLFTAFNIPVDILEFRLVDVRDEQGNLMRLRIAYQDLAEIQKLIIDRADFQAFIRQQPVRDINLDLFLAKQTTAFTFLDRKTLWRLLQLIHVVLWKMKSGHAEARPVLFAVKRFWRKEIEQYAAPLHLEIRWVRTFQFKVKEFLINIFGESRLKAFYYRLHVFTDLDYKNKKAKESLQPKQCSKLWVEYNGHLNLDKPECFSDLFFFQGAKFSFQDVVMSFSIASDPLNQEKWGLLKAKGIEAVALTPAAAQIKECSFFFPSLKKMDRLGFECPRKISEDREAAHWLTKQSRYFLQTRQDWVDFIQKFDIKLYASWFKYDNRHTVITSALRATGGISTVYQRAFEEFPSPETTTCADVFFGFSKWGVRLEEMARSQIKYYVITGYSGDHRYPYLKEFSSRIRKQLSDRGAKRVIAYFDEGSHEDSRWHTGHEFMREHYKFLLEKVIATPWLGIILKPKTPSTLRKRLGEIAGLLKEAEHSGRCVVFEQGRIAGDYPPSAAALGADVAVHGHLCASSAGLDAFLAGVPTLLMDREGWPRSALYKLGVGKVVFNDWAHLFRTCEEHWQREIPGFGDWSSMINELDPFRDGKAAERVGTYMQWLMDGFKQGLSRDQNLERAAQWYGEQWGKDKIYSINV